MRLVLHIGTEKTGTTTVQRWLDQNDAALAKTGIVYSRALGRANNRKIAVYPLPWDRDREAAAHYGIKSPDDFAAFRRTLRSGLVAEVEAARAQGAHTFVISSEHMHSRLVDAGSVQALHGLLAPLFGDEIVVLCYLRPQVDMVVSLLSTRARLNRIGPEALDPRPLSPYFDYLELRARWRGVFGDPLQFVPFKRVGDIVGDFCNRIGADATSLEAVERQNSSLDYRTAALFHNLYLPSIAEGEVNPNRGFFAEALPVEQPLTISRSEAMALDERFRDRNRAFADLVAGIEPEDLAPDLDRYPDKGNIERALEEVCFAPMLRQTVLRFNAHLWLERARTKIAEGERALVKGFPGRAIEFYRRAQAFLDKAGKAGLADIEADRAELADRVDRRIASARTTLDRKKRRERKRPEG